MTNYTAIAKEFDKHGYQQSSKYTQSQLNAALDKISRANIGVSEFDRSIAQQLFEQTAAQGEDKVSLKEYIGVILKAHQLLKKNIGVLRDQLRIENSQTVRSKNLEQLYQFQQDYRLLTLSFGLPAPEKIPELEGFAPESQLVVTEKTVKTEVVLDKDYESLDLIAVFIVTCIWLGLGLLSALTKQSFLNTLIALAILGIFLLRCFDKHYVRMCIVGLFLSLVFDLVWLLTLSSSFWNPKDPSHRSSRLVALMHLAYVLTIVIMALKLIVFVLIYPYKSNPPEFTKIVKFRAWQVTLAGNPSRNPLGHLFSKNAEVFGIQ